MSTLTIAELQLQVSTDLSDTALQQIIDAAERDIDEYIGPATAHVAEFGPASGATVLRLPVQGGSITSVVEYTDAESEPTETTLETDDYDLSDDGWWLRRLSSGTNPRSTWAWYVVVTFTPQADAARRKQAAVELARLSIVHSGFSEEKVGDWTGTAESQSQARQRILARLDEAYIE